MGAEDELLARRHVVGVVLHEGGAAGSPGFRHRLQSAQQHRGLPVALAAEAVAVGHEPLHGQAGQLAQAAEVLEVRGERLEAALLQEGAQAQLDPGRVTQRVVALAEQLGGHGVLLGIFLDQRRHVGVRGRVHHLDQVVDAVGVDRDAEAQLRLHLVALGDRHVAHVVAEAGQLERAHLGQALGGAQPGQDARAHGRIAHVPGHGLARHAEPGLDVPELAVAVRGLVQVHEVHVDGGPRQLDVGLRVQVQQRLAQRVEPGDPHLGRGEGVHPRDHAGALVVRVGFEHDPPDGRGVGQDGLPLHRHGQLLGDAPRLLGHLAQRVLAVQSLAAGQKPDVQRGLLCP